MTCDICSHRATLRAAQSLLRAELILGLTLPGIIDTQTQFVKHTLILTFLNCITTGHQPFIICTNCQNIIVNKIIKDLFDCLKNQQSYCVNQNQGYMYASLYQ